MTIPWLYLLFGCDDADSDAHDYRQMRDVEFETEAQKDLDTIPSSPQTEDR